MSEHQHNEHGHQSGHTENSGAHTPEAAKLVAAAQFFFDKEFKFSFKKQKIVDELGAEVKRPSVTLSVPIPTSEGFVASWGDPKVQTFVLDLVEEAIKDQVRAQLSDDEKPVNRQDELDLSKLTLEYIANMPKSERASSGISTETWEAWMNDYIETMTPIRKDVDRVTKAAKLFVGKLNACRTDKPVLGFLSTQLGIWATESKNAEDYADVFNYLDNRISFLLKKDEQSTLEAL